MIPIETTRSLFCPWIFVFLYILLRQKILSIHIVFRRIERKQRECEELEWQTCEQNFCSFGILSSFGASYERKVSYPACNSKHGKASDGYRETQYCEEKDTMDKSNNRSSRRLGWNQRHRRKWILPLENFCSDLSFLLRVSSCRTNLSLEE